LVSPKTVNGPSRIVEPLTSRDPVTTTLLDKIKDDEVEKVPFLKTLLLRGKKGKSFFARTKEMAHEEMDEFKVWCGVKKDFDHKKH